MEAAGHRPTSSVDGARPQAVQGFPLGTPRAKSSLATGLFQPSGVSTMFCDQPATLGSIFSLSTVTVKDFWSTSP